MKLYLHPGHMPIVARFSFMQPTSEDKRDVIQEGDAEFLRIKECGRDGWPKDCDLETGAERLKAAQDRFVFPRD
jgi:hypothetical protein